MKGLKVIIRLKNNARDKKIKELESKLCLESKYQFYSTTNIEKIKTEIDRDFPEYINHECVVLYNDTTQAVVEDLSDHKLHVVEIEGLTVVHEDEDDSNRK